jgi:fibronectin-binding autotransporter adhesin
MLKYRSLFGVSVIPFSLFATDYIWQGAAAPSNTWSTSTNWNPSGPPNVNTAGALFEGGGYTTVDVDDAITIYKLYFSGGLGYTLSPSGGSTITLDGSVTNSLIQSEASELTVIQVPLSLIGSSLTINVGGADVDIQGVISGSETVYKNGTGTVNLSGVNTYTGATNINAGTLALSAAGSIASSSIVNLGGTFDISGVNASTTISALSGTTVEATLNLGDKQLILGGSGNYYGYIVGEGGSIVYNGTGIGLFGTSSYTGPTTVNSGNWVSRSNTAYAPLSDFTVTSPGALNLFGFSNTINSLSGSGSVLMGGGGGVGMLTITNGGDFSGNISQSLGITLNGGTLTLSGTNTYTGATTLTGTAELVANSNLALSASSDVILDDMSKLTLNKSNAINSLSGAEGTLVDIVGTSTTLFINNGSGSPLNQYAGIIQGTGELSLTGGTLTLTGNNTFSGGTAIASGASLLLEDSGSLLSTGEMDADGTFDISGIISSTEIGNLGTSSGIINLGGKQLIVNQSISNNFKGNIIGVGGSFEKAGTALLTLSGINTYSGPTNVAAGTLQAESTTAFAPLSDFTVNSILDLNSYSNSINSLSGSGSVPTGTLAGGTLSIANGGDFSGEIFQNGGVTLKGGTLSLSGNNNYNGATNIFVDAILQAGIRNAFAPYSDVIVNGTLDLANFDNTIKSLQGAGAVLTGTIESATLTITNGSNGGSFSGGISGIGNLNLTGGTLNLSTAIGQNTYSGVTTISDSATLEAGAQNAFSPNSAYEILDTGTLNLSGYNNTIFSLDSLSNNSSVTLGGAILTINGNATTTFAGTISNVPCGGLTIDGGTNLTLTGASGYCGPTSIVNGTLNIASNNALAPLSDVTVSSAGTLDLSQNGGPTAANSLSNSGTVINNGTLTLKTSYTQNAGAELNLGFDTNGVGKIISTTGYSLNGNLVVTATGTPATTSVVYILLDTPPPYMRSGVFNTFTPVNFPLGSNPLLSYSVEEVSLYFAKCAATWNYSGNGNWEEAVDNWDPECAPGTNGNENDTATFADGLGFPSNITVTLANADGDAPEQFTLFQLNFDAADTSFAVQEFNSQSALIFDANPSGTPTINVELGSHSINAPIVLNQNTEIFLNDGTMLTLGELTTLNSQTTQSLTIAQNGISPVGTGSLVNYGILSPYSMRILSATVKNYNEIIPVNSLTIIPAAGITATIFNSGTDAQFGPSGLNGSVVIGGAGTTNVTNDGVHAHFGPLGANGNMTIGGSGTTTVVNVGEGAGFGPAGDNGSIMLGSSGTTEVVNSGDGASFGPTGVGGDITISGSGPMTILNSGDAAFFGPSGVGGDITISGSGPTTIDNTGDGAFFGPSGIGGNFTISNSGPITIDNIGDGASFGPSGTGGNLTISGSGATTITNSGLCVSFGPSGKGGDFYLSTGSITNSNGATLHAGPKGTFYISGGSITNDVTSTVGSSCENIVFTGGFLNTSGNVLAFDYTQTAPAILQLNITSPTVYGNVRACGTASLGGTLIINALPGSITASQAGQTFDFITACKGISGAFSSINLLNFPVGIIPELFCNSNSIGIALSPTITSTSLGSIPQIPSTSVTATNFRVERELHLMHQRMMKRCKKNEKCEVVEVNGSVHDHLFASANSVELVDHRQPLLVFTDPIQREQHILEERIMQEEVNPSRFYFGPIDNFGDFEERGKAQAGFGYNSIGLFTGVDHAFEEIGIGISADYTTTSAKVDHHQGKFYLDQLHGDAYLTYVPHKISELAIEAIGGYAYEWLTTRRKTGSILNSTTAKGHTHGMEFDALLGAEYIFSKKQFHVMPRDVLVTPLFNMQYIWAGFDKYNESNASIFNLKVHDQHMESLRSTLGTRFEYLVKGENVTFKPEVDIAWQREFLDHDRCVNFSTICLPKQQNISERVDGAGRNTLLFGVDFFITVYKVFEIEMSYDLQWNSLYVNNSFYLGIGGNF